MSNDEVFEMGDFTADLIPVGDYTVRCVDLEKGESQAGNDMWIWSVMVEGGDHNGEDMRVYTALTSNALWKLAETVRAFGLGATEGKGCKFKRDDAIGAKATATVVHEEYDGKTQASIKKLSPLKKDPKKAAKKATRKRSRDL